MVRKLKIFLLTGVLLASVCQVGFSQYADLVGKLVRVNGHWDWKYLGVALNEQDCDKLITALADNDKAYFDKLLEAFDILRIKNDTLALVMDTKVLEGKAKIVIRNGLYEGSSGWIPIAWLEGNARRPRISDEPKEHKDLKHRLAVIY